MQGFAEAARADPGHRDPVRVRRGERGEPGVQVVDEREAVAVGDVADQVEDGVLLHAPPYFTAICAMTGLPATAGSFAILSLVTYEYLSKKVGTIGKSSSTASCVFV